MTRWTRVALVAAALVLAPAATQSFSVPAAIAAYGDDAYGDDAYRDPGAWPDEGPGPAVDGRGAWLPGEWGTEPDPGPGPEPGTRAIDNRRSGDGLCRPGTPPTASPTTQVYNANPLLGPALLPTASPVGPLLAGYDRFGGRTEDQFIQQYTNANHLTYVYPPFDGFALENGRPITTRQELLTGYRLDRFGNPGGQFLSPLGTPFSSRALPPANLTTPGNAPLANYHVYCVIKPFSVDSGPIAPWFAQPGWGTQYKLNATYLPEAGTALTVTWLLQNGFLVEENLTADDGACRDGGTWRQHEPDRAMC